MAADYSYVRELETPDLLDLYVPEAAAGNAVLEGELAVVYDELRLRGVI
jgi:hypothetical protein